MLGRLWLSSMTLGRRQRYRDVNSHFCRSMSGKRGPGLEEQETARRALEAAAREDRLDFATAAKILMTTPAKERKFGWDFHLVQFFFACLPPLAAYLVAQYSRHEQRRMLKERDAKLEKIIDAEFETEVEAELQEAAVILSTNDTDLALLSLRLEALEARLKQLEPAVLKARIVDHPAEEAARHDVEGGKKQSTDAVDHAGALRVHFLNSLESRYGSSFSLLLMMLKKVLASCQGTRTETLAIWKMSMEMMATGGGGDGREIKGKTRNLAMSKTAD